MNIGDGGVHMLRNGGRDGLSADAAALQNGRNSGYQAINFAVLAGAKRIALLGYDGRAQGGQTHWFGDHPVRTPEANLACYARNFNNMTAPLQQLGVEVVNCSPGTVVTAFPRIPLDLVTWFKEQSDG